MHDFFQRLIKQSQSFETSHATAKTTKYYQKDIKHDMQKSKPQSKQAPFCTSFGIKNFSFPTPFKPF
jgi:hypothetical protein